MKHSRKIALVVNHVNVGEEDALDVLFWLDKSPAERLSEVSRLRKNYFTWADGSFPEKIEKAVHFRKI